MELIFNFFKDLTMLDVIKIMLIVITAQVFCDIYCTIKYK